LIAIQANDLLECISGQHDGPASDSARELLDLLPPDDFADTAPGMSICYSLQEWQFKDVLPFLRGSVTRWSEWLKSPSDPWPEPTNLRACVAALEGIRASMQPHDEPPATPIDSAATSPGAT
jgi:hypothetical protein